MQLTVSATHLGTPESSWLSFAPLAQAPLLRWPALGRIVVIAPHPDDEVLGVGGTLRSLVDLGHEIEIIAVTDGEGSHPHSRVITGPELAEQRAQERSAALALLGVRALVTTLHARDSAVANEPRLAERLAVRLAGASCCLAPWSRDGHPDHDAAGIAAEYACAMTGVQLLQYPIWAWHWDRPGRGALPWDRARRVLLTPAVHQAKRVAINAYRSQIEPLGDDEPILPREVLARFERPFEVLFV